MSAFLNDVCHTNAKLGAVKDLSYAALPEFSHSTKMHIAEDLEVDNLVMTDVQTNGH